MTLTVYVVRSHRTFTLPVSACSLLCYKARGRVIFSSRHHEP